jgi:hypothetical protein
MKGSAKRKCLCCGEFYPPDRRNLRHQRYCSKPACRKESKAQSQRRWQQRPENQNYFRGPENRERVKDWRKRNPGYWRKKTSSTQEPLQEVFQAQTAQNEELIPKEAPDALQDLFSMQPAVVVGLISMMTGSALQEDIVSTVGVLVRKGRDILGMNPGSETTRPNDENQTTSLSATTANCAASV